MSAITLSQLIESVEEHAPSDDPLDLLATASATAADVSDLTDSMLSHFVDRCRKAGCSWSEIGNHLGVSKQAVQKRFTRPPGEPRGWDRFTDRTKQVVLEYAPQAAISLGHGWVGTEHLLLGFWGVPECVATKVLEQLNVTRDAVEKAVKARVERGDHQEPTFTPRAWSAVNGAAQRALEWGHNYVGTEHILLALVSGAGGMAEEILAEAGVDRGKVQPVILEMLSGFVRRRNEP